MKNFKGLHKCATGAVINTEDFMKSNQSNIGSMLEGATSGWPKKTKWQKAQKKKRKNICHGTNIN